ncbi:hypothetical protein BV349_03802 [Pseudomonas syringae pv. actinidiae]|nr:hypothetical protein BV349_03802 [Pseudomonas syringae pv. actinidiae]OSN74926.1 hypothetical protein BV351_04149 [Pseudomonas syringae pv. actinidiae]
MLCRNTLPYIVVVQLRRGAWLDLPQRGYRQACEGSGSGRHLSTRYQFSPKPSIVIFIHYP